MVSARVAPGSRWKGLTVETPSPFAVLGAGCFHTLWPLGRSMGRGSPKPRTPRIAPK